MLSQSFKEHPLWSLLENVQEQALKIKTEKPELDANQKHILIKRLPLIIGSLQGHRNNTSAFYSETQLDEMQRAWDDVRNYLNNLVPSYTYSTDNLSARIDAALKVASSWPDAYTFKGAAATKAVSTFTNAQETLISRIDVLEQTILTKNEELKEQAENHKNELEQIEQKLNQLKQTISETQSGVQQQQEQISELTVKHNETFDGAQTERRQQWEEWLANRKTDYDAQADEEIAVLKQTEETGKETLNSIQKLHEETEKAAGNAVSAVLARDHGSYSLRDYLTGWGMLLCGVGLTVVAITFLLRSMSTITPETHVTWQWAAMKITLTLLISAGATFLFTLAKQFFDKAAETKRIELELRTIHPFLSEIQDAGLIDETKVDFIKRSFGQQTAEGTESKTLEETSEKQKKLEMLLSIPDTVIKTLIRNNGQ